MAAAAGRNRRPWGDATACSACSARRQSRATTPRIQHRFVRETQASDAKAASSEKAAELGGSLHFRPAGYSVSARRGVQGWLRASPGKVLKAPCASGYLRFAEQQPPGTASSLQMLGASPVVRCCPKKAPKGIARPPGQAGWSPHFPLRGAGSHPNSHRPIVVSEHCPASICKKKGSLGGSSA